MLVATLAILAAPASAHAHHDGNAVLAQGSDTSPDSQQRQQADHDRDHNAADHSHPIGDDTYHQKVSHSLLDFAHHQAVAIEPRGLLRAAGLPVVDEAAHGLALEPPIRPPLG